MEMNAILARFQDVTDQPDGGYLAVCPGHNDSKPSLRIWFGQDGRVRMTCRAGCKTGDVIAAVQIPWRDMFNATGTASVVSSKRADLVGTAEIARLRMYLDSLAYGDGYYAWDRFGIDGAEAQRLDLRYAAPATDGPDFLSTGFRRHPRLIVPLVSFDGVARGLQGRDLSGDCPARWMSLSNPEDLRWSPYGVFWAAEATDTFIVTEGPGDGLTAVAAGYHALIIRGASLVNSPELVAELAAGLKEYRVVVAGDNDRAGQEFTQRLTDGLAAHGVTAHPLSIPHAGDDLTDWRARNVARFPAQLTTAVNAASAPPAQDVPQAVAQEEPVDVDAPPTREAVALVKELYYQTLKEYGSSDVQGAYLLAAFSAGSIKYAPGLGYFTWTGRVWERSDTKVRNMIHAIGRTLRAAADEKTAEMLPDQKEDPGEGLRKAAKGFTTRRRIDDMMAELQSIPAVHVATSEFDRQQDLLSFRNGTVNLRTGVLQAHHKDDLLTYCLDIDYRPDAEAPRWERFLAEIFPDMPEMPSYIQRLTGVGVTGHTSEQCFCVLWGKGANGKSVLMDTLTNVFRSITSTTPFSTFEEKASGGIPNDIAALRGSRLVMASEGEANRPMSEALLKRITGKDEITARFLRQEYFTFKPQFLLMLATNFKPKFRGQDEGLWRRVKLVPFTRFFAPDEQDHSLDTSLAAEAEGIAAWVVRGAQEWYRNGLQDPERIREATKEYRKTSDAMAGFFPGVLERCDDERELTAGEAYQAYKQWCEAEGLPMREQWTRRTFLDAMEERQVGRVNTVTGVSLVGVRIRTEHADAPAGPGIFA